MLPFKKIFNILFSPSAAGLYTLLFGAAIGIATFVENDFGTSAAQKMIFKTHWFEAIIVFFGISIVANIFRFRMIPQKKWAILTFHLSIIVIIIGAGVTRYFGSEGMMGVREGETENTFLSAETYLQFQAIHNGQKYTFNQPVLFASLGDNTIKKKYMIGSEMLDVEVRQFIPNPKENLIDDPAGMPIIKVVIGGANGREEFLVHYLDKVEIYGTLFNFGNADDPAAFNIHYKDNNLTFVSGSPYLQMVMATQTRDTLPAGVEYPLRLRSLYSNGQQSFVFGDFKPAARTEVASASRKMNSNSMGAVEMKLRFGGEEKDLLISGAQGVEGRPGMVSFGSTALSVAYGAKRVSLPFGIQLRDFIMERYPGTNSASSYASEVTLIDPRSDLRRDQRIFMNNILNYDGYRFFQSSYDPDELGTYLSVNHDAPGTWISYFGYFLLTLGMILTLFSPKSRFRQLGESIGRMRKEASATVVLILSLGLNVWAGPAPQTPTIDRDHAKLFGKALMQDHNGRLKPMNTFAGEVMRKLARKESLFGLSSEQIILSMMMQPEDWYGVPVIKIGKHEEIKKMLGVEGPLVSYRDFFNTDGTYKLADAIRAAVNAPPRDRGVFEKELIKLDEKVNICSMIFTGRFLTVFPLPGDTSHTWLSPDDALHQRRANVNGSIIEQYYPMYVTALQNAVKTGEWNLANQMVIELRNYQQKYGDDILPSESKVNAELWLNRLDVFNRLGKLYGLLGLLYLGLMFTSVFSPKRNLKGVALFALGLLFFGFAMHTTGLGLRWYVSGRAPWSNGYESMIYIGWTTVLAGLIFSRKSLGALTATNVLAATIMMVAGLSWLDPEITPLVPVLKSYWLTIHVSLEAGSYGFLVLGAIIGVLNLIFMIVATPKNEAKVYRIIDEMTMISEMTLIAGLFMVSIGTYLGGVWANESWGRYWGWDAKETWALVTILVYSFILHMRFIPGLRGVYAFNVATLFGWASVAMTYFGVNYYLSGLHSYAAGDPVPMPAFVYQIVAGLILVSLLAKWRHQVYLRRALK